MEGKFPRVLLTVEPFLLQNEGRNAVFKQRQARVMGSRYESEDAHEVPTRDLEVGSVRGNWAGREDCRGLALSQIKARAAPNAKPPAMVASGPIAD